MRKLASIQKIESLEPIKGADFIEKAKVLGWTLVVKKGEFQAGDSCVYFEIDSLLPQKPCFDFINQTEVYTLTCKDCMVSIALPLKKAENASACPNCRSNCVEIVKTSEFRKDRSRKLTTKKMKGIISQGLAMPLSIIEEVTSEKLSGLHLSIGDDLTEMLGVKKWEAIQNPSAGGNVKGSFPFYVPKTDEIRIQSIPEIFKEISKEQLFYISIKLDGTSGTFVHKDGEIDICSRNLSLKDTEEGMKSSYYWYVAHKYKIVEKIKKYGNIAVQGEICGPGIQKNRLNLKEISLFLFDVYIIDEQKYADLALFKKIAEALEIPTVPILQENFIFDENTTIESLLKMAEGKYEGTKNEREGIVIRPVKTTTSEMLKGRLSFKVISNKFLLKGGD